MAKVIVIGDGPAGLSGALFLAKNGHEVVIYAQGQRRHALRPAAQLPRRLANMPGTDCLRIVRDQLRHGAQLRDDGVSEVTAPARASPCVRGRREDSLEERLS